MTFVSSTMGWVLGTLGCVTPPCTAEVWKTTDAGHSWSRITAPPEPLSAGEEPDTKIRFANASDGWVALPHLWATHDGGAHWTRQPIDYVFALEASAGLVHAVVGPVSRTDGFRFQIQTSPVHRDDWRLSRTELYHGAGPQPGAQIVLHGSAGWLVIVNRAIADAARLTKGQWVPWKPPCDDAGTPFEFAASTATDLVALCEDGLWNSLPAAVRIFVSTDGGSSSRHVPAAIPVHHVYSVAAASRDVWVVGSDEPADRGSGWASVLLRTTDGGHTWNTVQREPEGGWVDLGFTSPQQGVVISAEKVRRLLMTHDGGQTWAPVPVG